MPKRAMSEAEAAHDPETPQPWRVGRKLGRTLYIGDECIGMVDTPELATSIVAAMNARQDLNIGIERDEHGSY